VAVLIDGATRGGVEPVAELLQRTGRATLVGEPTAGASVDAELVPLPGGWTALVPVATWVTWDGRWMERTPVEPDVRVAAASALTRALRLLD
jgi:carboxyl-terminal processing protease